MFRKHGLMTVEGTEGGVGPLYKEAATNLL